MYDEVSKVLILNALVNRKHKGISCPDRFGQLVKTIAMYLNYEA